MYTVLSDVPHPIAPLLPIPHAVVPHNIVFALPRHKAIHPIDGAVTGYHVKSGKKSSPGVALIQSGDLHPAPR